MLIGQVLGLTHSKVAAPAYCADLRAEELSAPSLVQLATRQYLGNFTQELHMHSTIVTAPSVLQGASCGLEPNEGRAMSMH